MLISWLLLAGLLPDRIYGSTTIDLDVKAVADTDQPLLESFVSYSIEFAFFPDFAGNSTVPNIFSYNLLSNIGNLQGSNPIIRVGGNTQDYAIYNASLPVATFGIYNFSKSADYPTTLTIGPSYFDSYSTWPNTKFIHGFNLAKNGSVGLNSLLAEVPLACKALEGGKLAYWELGNEPDLYKTSAQGVVRPSNWTEPDYVDEWLGKTRQMKQVMTSACPDLAQNSTYQFIAPSFGGTSNSLDPIITWRDGLNTDGDIALISSHKYARCSKSSSVLTNQFQQLHWRSHSARRHAPGHSYEPFLNCCFYCQTGERIYSPQPIWPTIYSGRDQLTLQ